MSRKTGKKGSGKAAREPQSNIGGGNRALPSNILVRTPNWIGDQILAFPFFHYLRKSYPKARIAAACVPWVESVQFRDLVDEVIILPRPIERTWSARLKAVTEGARKLRSAGPWDLAISLPNSFSSAWMLYRSGSRIRRGFSGDSRGWLLNERLDWEPFSSGNRAEAYVQLLPKRARPELSVQEFWGVLPENVLDEKVPGELESFDPARSWPDVEPLQPPDEPYWVLAPGSTAESRRWPAENFAALARKIEKETGWKGLIVGGVAEGILGEELSEDRALKLSDWTAKGPATSLWKVFKNAQLTVSNDSGLAHLASLCGSPVQITWGAGDPKKTMPLGPGKVGVLFNPIECWPCEKNVCARQTGQKLECIKSILPETVWQEILKNDIRNPENPRNSEIP